MARLNNYLLINLGAFINKNTAAVRWDCITDKFWSKGDKNVWQVLK